ncbi:NADP-dependent oxidoreductase domain-containing protein [Aspergillus pseudocaelatus]|uniref:NADP-dependent oxidoreductase domain-containing protein n=1 Tax=Aspergillus pseudocaelatus TaxID=1825620 RepID=A0ABQ6X4D5_9EURO|nr:NADP-dependent oxidoreductase domain-containing protein [Aspergillus pseudocaelatus]
MAQTMTTRVTSYTLNTGMKAPALGFGTFQKPNAQEATVSMALQKVQVGKEIQRSGISQKDIFLYTKLWCNDYHPDDVESVLDNSLRDLDTIYINLLMIHYPCTFKQAMEKLTGTGKVSGIGVSNFSKGEIETLLKESSTVIDQIEVDPYLQHKSFAEWLQAKVIHGVQFSPLGNMNDFYRQTGWSKDIVQMRRVMGQLILKDIGHKYGKSPVQVVLVWGINHRRSVIPKSVVDWQIEKSLAADLELQAEDMAQVATLDAKACFNDPSLDYKWQLYRDLQGG